MVFKGTKITFDNGIKMVCKKILIRSEKYVALLSNDNAHEVYNCLGEKISPENCTYIASGVCKNQLILGINKSYKVFLFENNTLCELEFSFADTPLVAEEFVDISVISVPNKKRTYFRYLLTVKIGNKYRKGLGTSSGGTFLIEPSYTNIKVDEAGYIVENQVDGFKQYGMFDFDGNKILEVEFSNLYCRYGMIFAFKPYFVQGHNAIYTQKVGVFDFDGKEILPIKFRNINVTEDLLIAEIFEKERFFHFYHRDGSVIYEGNCTHYQEIDSRLLITETNPVTYENLVGVLDIVNDEIIVPIKHHKITLEHDCFVIYDEFDDASTNEKEKLRIVQIIYKDIVLKYILTCEEGFERVYFLDRYIVAEKQNGEVRVVDYSGKILARKPKERDSI